MAIFRVQRTIRYGQTIEADTAQEAQLKAHPALVAAMQDIYKHGLVVFMPYRESVLTFDQALADTTEWYELEV